MFFLKKNNIFYITKTHTHLMVQFLGIKFKFKDKNVHYSFSNNGNGNIFVMNSKTNGKFYINGNNNNVNSLAENSKINIRISGNNNQVIIKENCKFNDFSVNIFGNNNKISIDENFVSANWLCIEIGVERYNKQTNNTHFTAKENTTFRSGYVGLLENNSTISIGKECMFSDNIDLRCTDGHSVLNMNGDLVNKGCFIDIGNHVWIAKNVFITKNTKIPSNSIVGACSVITKQFDEENIVIAGNPAKICKHKIDWDRMAPDVYAETRSVVERE